LELSPDQRTAARALGCAFFPASEAQVARLTMQRRIFRLDGQPVMVSRDGAYYETHSTLLALIEGHGQPEAREAVEPVAVAEEVVEAAPGDGAVLPDPAGRPVPRGASEPTSIDAVQAATSMPETVRHEPLPEDAVPTAVTEPARPPRAAVRSRKAADDTAPSMEATGAPATTGSADALQVRERRPRRSPGYEPPTPRWQVAGKLRRGRLK
jgi:hypothetical protein